MKLSLTVKDFKYYIDSQLNTFFPDNQKSNIKDNENLVELAISRTEFCFKHCSLPSYYSEGNAKLNHLHADQYLVFIWILSHTIWEEKKDITLANKLYYLNKILHGFDCMYDTRLPDIFLVFHGVGSVIGKATYSNFLTIAHGVTVGNHRGIYPKIGKGVALTAHSSIVGNCIIGDRVSVSVGTRIFERNVPADTLVFTDEKSGETKTKPSRNYFARNFFNCDIE